MISTDKTTEIFFEIGEFCKVFEPAYTQRLLEDSKKHRKRAFKMSMSETLTITIIFLSSVGIESSNTSTCTTYKSI